MLLNTYLNTQKLSNSTICILKSWGKFQTKVKEKLKERKKIGKINFVVVDVSLMLSFDPIVQEI